MMPAVRARRRSSLAYEFNAPKPGLYGIPSPPSTTATAAASTTVTFAPNVTPITYTQPDPDDDIDLSYLDGSSADPSSLDPSSNGLESKLFPPSTLPAPPPSRRRVPPGKRRSLGYIPRPPNAFMLFRADFVRQKHVPGSIETNHGSLSKIIGNCWRALPLDEKRVWEIKAKHAKAEHKARYPEYRFRPVHTKKNKNGPGSATPASSTVNKSSRPAEPSGSQVKAPITPEEEQRCEDVAQLLLQGKKGEDLRRAVEDLDRARAMERQQQQVHFGQQHHAEQQHLEPPSFEGFSFTPIAHPQLPLVPLRRDSLMFYQPTYGQGPTDPLAPIASDAEMENAQRMWTRRSSSVPLPFSNPFAGPNGAFLPPPEADGMVDPHHQQQVHVQHHQQGANGCTEGAFYPGSIALPSIPFLSHPNLGVPPNAAPGGSRPLTPSMMGVGGPSQAERNFLGMRRASSVQGVSWAALSMGGGSGRNSWSSAYVNNANNGFSAFHSYNYGAQGQHQQEVGEEELPEPDHSMFNPTFSISSSASPSASSPNPNPTSISGSAAGISLPPLQVPVPISVDPHTPYSAAATVPPDSAAPSPSEISTPSLHATPAPTEIPGLNILAPKPQQVPPHVHVLAPESDLPHEIDSRSTPGIASASSSYPSSESDFSGYEQLDSTVPVEGVYALPYSFNAGMGGAMDLQFGLPEGMQFVDPSVAQEQGYYYQQQGYEYQQHQGVEC